MQCEWRIRSGCSQMLGNWVWSDTCRSVCTTEEQTCSFGGLMQQWMRVSTPLKIASIVVMAACVAFQRPNAWRYWCGSCFCVWHELLEPSHLKTGEGVSRGVEMTKNMF